MKIQKWDDFSRQKVDRNVRVTVVMCKNGVWLEDAEQFGWWSAPGKIWKEEAVSRQGCQGPLQVSSSLTSHGRVNILWTFNFLNLEVWYLKIMYWMLLLCKKAGELFHKKEPAGSG
jgi:hypothetical protein